jgi:hypothetical protein
LGLAERAFRRPLSESQVAALKQTFDAEVARSQARVGASAPVGFHDSSEGMMVSGWAADPTWLEHSVEIHFYVDAPYPTGTFAGATVADLPRPDVVAAGYPGDHGFTFRIPDQWADGLPHTIYAHAIGGGILPPATVTARAFRSLVPGAVAPVSDRSGYRPTWFREGIRSTVTAILASPFFLFKFEPKVSGVSMRPLDEFEVASRLSFFLTGSIPDEELLATAKAGQLLNPGVLQA